MPFAPSCPAVVGLYRYPRQSETNAMLPVFGQNRISPVELVFHHIEDSRRSHANSEPCRNEFVNYPDCDCALSSSNDLLAILLCLVEWHWVREHFNYPSRASTTTQSDGAGIGFGDT
jgi:hypothetical protein